MPPKHHDREWLIQKYIVEGNDQYEVAEICGVDQSTIHYWLRKLDVPTRPRGERSRYRVYYTMNNEGYQVWKTKIGEKHHTVLVHRLLAIAEYGFDAVCGNHVHHKNGVTWDNRPDNVEVLGPGEHIELHHSEGYLDDHLDDLHERLRNGLANTEPATKARWG